MAISTPLQSPGIFTREIDLTGVVPNVPTSTGAFVGDFRWGPVEQPVLISTETGLIETFGTPDSDNTVEWHAASYFLRYSNELQVVRAIPDSGAYNSFVADSSTVSDAYGDSASEITPPTVKNRDNWDVQKATLANTTELIDSNEVPILHTFIAKYPGELGNNIQVDYFLGGDSASSTQDSDFDAWTYSSYFDQRPGTSSYAADYGCTHDEFHVVVVDKTGLISGTRGTVLETFPFVSMAKGATKSDGSTNYGPEVISNASNYIWMAGFGVSDLAFPVVAGADPIVNENTAFDAGYTGSRAISKTLSRGSNGDDLDVGDYSTGFDQFEDKDTILVDFLIAPGLSTREAQTTIVNDLVSIAQSTRKDCVVVTSPAQSDIIDNNTPVTATVATAKTFTQSSYLIMDNNYLKVYDKYNDQYINIPAASSVAGIMAATDQVAAPWFSPAGPRRGQLLGITSLAYSPNQTERDTLYKNGINPIANIPGQGVLLFGDKTKLARPSAFDRINVRRLFLAVERAIAIAARNVLFEFNDEFTRNEFKNIVEPFLREIQGRRGITDFRVVCDETNNTAAVIDRNEFVCSIFIKPARSINFVTLNFVAVRTGVDFEEVVGTV